MNSLDIKRFKENLVPLITTPSGDNAFSSLRILTHGMAGTRTAKIINFASLCMDTGEFYLEVGTFSGFTLISASYQNNSTVIGIDDFTAHDMIRSDAPEENKTKARDVIRHTLKRNCELYGTPLVQFIESNFKNIRLEEEAKGKLCVLFIDGDHTYEEAKQTVKKFEPYFSKDCVLIFDDVQFGQIPKYIHELCLTDYEMLLYAVSTTHEHDTNVHKNMPLNEFIANGIAVLVRKNAPNS